MRGIPRSRCSLVMAMLVASPIFWRGSPTPLERRQYLTPEGQAASVDSYTLEANCRSLGLPTPARATFFTARVARAREARVPGTPVGPRDDSFKSRRRPRACAAPASHPGHARQIHPGRAPDRFISTGCRQDAGATKNRNRPACPTSSSGAGVYLFYRTSKGDQRSKRDPPQRRPERKLRASLSARGGSLGTTHLRFSGVRWILHSRSN